MGEFDRPGEFADLSEDERQKALAAGLIDMGGGKSAFTLDDQVVEACRGGSEYASQVIEKARVLAQNIKENGANFYETWAAVMALGKSVDAMDRGSYVLLTYMITEQAFKDS